MIFALICVYVIEDQSLPVIYMYIRVQSSHNEHKLSELECIMYAKIYDSEQQGSCWYDMIASRFPGTPPHAASSSKKPRSRGIFHSLFCCLCHDETDHVPVNNNAPLLVEENGTISKVRVISVLVTSYFDVLP